MEDTAQILIKRLNLKKHPEGGYFAEHYRSVEKINKEHLPSRFKGSRVFSTAIYFLLIGNDFSSFHRLKADEVWHFYSGSPLRLYEIDDDGHLETTILNGEINEKYQFTKDVKAGKWLAAEVIDKNSYALVGCTLSPGFEFEDFELAERIYLMNLFPQHKKIIEKLTHPI